MVKGFARAEDRVLLLEAETEASNRLSHVPQTIQPSALDPALQAKVEKKYENLKNSQKEFA